ncbi:MAG: DUF2304 domain-containing protein [Patescibacteria group bacterium]
MLFKILLAIFAVVVMVRVFKQYRAKKVGANWFGFWMIFWVLVIVVSYTPQTTDLIAQVVGVGRGVDLIVYISLPIIFYSIFRLVVRQDQQNKELTDLVRKIAIDNAEKPKN